MPSKRKRRGKRVDKLLSTYATIVDLPNEILLMILSQLGKDDLYSLALLCKRLHTMALPIYLSMFQVSGSWAVSLTDASLAGLPGLRIALFITQINHFSCNLLNARVGQLRGLQRLVSRMSNVQGVNFRCDPYYVGMVRQVGAKDFVELLGALAEKSCQYLYASGSGLLVKIPQQLKIPPFQSLRTATISLASLFVIPLQHWTIKSLNSSPLCTLSFDGIPDDLLLKVLPRLKLPHLQNLCLSSTTLPFTSLAAFWSRHHGISALTISRHQSASPKSHYSLPAKILPQLCNLQANMLAISPLLSNPEAFPKLKTVTIDRDRYISVTLTKVLAQLSSTNVSRLSLSLYDNNDTEMWLKTHGRRLRSSSARIESSLHHLKSIDLVLVDVREFNKGITRRIPAWLALFPALTYVGFSDWSPYWSKARGEVASFLKEVALECPKLDGINFNGVGGTVAQWKAGNSLQHLPA